MKKFSIINIKNCKSLFLSNFKKTITTGSNKIMLNKHNISSNRFSLVSCSYKNFFSQNHKDKNEDDENDSDNKVLKDKYNELKEMCQDQNNKLEVVKKKFEELRKAYLTNMEESEQIKIRNDRELASTKEFAISKFAKDLLDVHDNFNRAFTSMGEKNFSSLSEEEKQDTFNSFIEGKIYFYF
jgi:molecular chaperone GrpE (heat shock protein)